jgi:transcriptional regulator with XRE-family HTH domain
MSASTTEMLGRAGAGFPALLKSWRAKRRMSQLELALASGVSQRHVSFLESGRAKPSRAMILQLSETLAVPLRDRNDWLTAAGFAPLFRARALDDPQMAQVMHALRAMLDGAAPCPAVVLDRAWNVRLSNRSFDLLCGALGPDLWARLGGGERNLMRLFFHPNGIRPWVANWASIAPLLWRRAQREAEALGGQEMQAVLADLSRHQDAHTLQAAEDAALVPVLPLEIRKDSLRISLFSVIATFGTAQDITADELRIETLYPADDATRALLQGLA